MRTFLYSRRYGFGLAVGLFLAGTIVSVTDHLHSTALVALTHNGSTVRPQPTFSATAAPFVPVPTAQPITATPIAPVPAVHAAIPATQAPAPQPQPVAHYAAPVAPPPAPVAPAAPRPAAPAPPPPVTPTQHMTVTINGVTHYVSGSSVSYTFTGSTASVNVSWSGFAQLCLHESNSSGGGADECATGGRLVAQGSDSTAPRWTVVLSQG